MRLPASVYVAVLCLVAALSGCDRPPAETQSTPGKGEGRRVKIVPGKSTEGFLKHWTVGSKSAWYSASRHEVLITDSATGSILKVAELPREYGRVVATGWERNERFFVHFSHGPDSGTMVYIDLDRQVVTKVEPWAAP